jgi:hypothetical protein
VIHDQHSTSAEDVTPMEPAKPAASYINIHPWDHKPTFHLLAEGKPNVFASIDLGAHVALMEERPEVLVAYADAFLAAAQALEAQAEQRAARVVNEANATTDAQPFGALPVAS